MRLWEAAPKLQVRIVDSEAEGRYMLQLCYETKRRSAMDTIGYFVRLQDERFIFEFSEDRRLFEEVIASETPIRTFLAELKPFLNRFKKNNKKRRRKCDTKKPSER